MRVGYEIRNVMTHEIVTLKAEATLGEAMQLMVEKDIGSVVITREGEKVGILTERDVLKNICNDYHRVHLKVAEVMSRPLEMIDGSASIGEAADRMAKKRIRRLLVSEEQRVVGIVTERDIMRATLDVFRKLSDAWV